MAGYFGIRYGLSLSTPLMLYTKLFKFYFSCRFPGEMSSKSLSKIEISLFDSSTISYFIEELFFEKYFSV